MSDSTLDPSRFKRQFSLRTLLVVTTILCVLLALPNGFKLILLILVWLGIGLLILWPMVHYYAPIYRFIAGADPLPPSKGKDE